MLVCILCSPGEYNLSSPVLVVQINATEPVELPENGTVSMAFKIPEVCNALSNYVYLCIATCISLYWLLRYLYVCSCCTTQKAISRLLASYIHSILNT